MQNSVASDVCHSVVVIHVDPENYLPETASCRKTDGGVLTL